MTQPCARVSRRTFLLIMLALALLLCGLLALLGYLLQFRIFGGILSRGTLKGRRLLGAAGAAGGGAGRGSAARVADGGLGSRHSSMSATAVGAEAGAQWTELRYHLWR